MKSNRIIRRDKSVRPAARLVNSGPNTTKSLLFSVHLILFFLSVQPATRRVNSGPNTSQLSLMSMLNSRPTAVAPSVNAFHFYFLIF